MEKIKVAFFVPSFVHVLDLTGSIQVFYEANGYGANYELSYFSLNRDTISSAGLYFSKLMAYSKINLRRGDYLFLPGAEMDYLRSDKFKKQKNFFKWLSKMYNGGVNICTVCTGAFILAEAGLLNGTICTTHWKRIEELQTTHPDLQIKKDVLFTHKNGIYTSAGITSGIDLSLSIVEEHYGSLFAHKVSRELLVYYRRGGNQSQESIYLNYRNHIQYQVHVIQDWLIENLHQQCTIAQLSSVVNMSERNLTRAFKKATGLTINEYIKKLRLEKLQALKQGTNLTNENIAGKIGYKSSRQLRRIKNNKQ